MLNDPELAAREIASAAKFCAPLFWREAREPRPRNGSAFFVRSKSKTFGITSFHVIAGWLASRTTKDGGPLLIAGDGVRPTVFDWNSRRIASHDKIDVATFEVFDGELEHLGKYPLIIPDDAWPPKVPKENEPIVYAGYPTDCTRMTHDGGPIFGLVSGKDGVSSVSERNVSICLKREQMQAVYGEGLPPENFNFGGISGGVLLRCVDNLIPFRLGGVIYQGPNTSAVEGEAIRGCEIICARRADFILSTGELDVIRWEQLE